MENLTVEELKKIVEKQHQALADIHSVIFLNDNIPKEERKKVLCIIESSIRLDT